MPFGGLLTTSIIGAGASIFGGLLGKSAADKAAAAQAAAEQKVGQLASTTIPKANDLYQKNYDTNMGLIQPYLSTGTNALTQLNGLVNNGGFQAPTAVTEQNDPGYQFRMQQGQLALDRSAASRGQALGGGAVKAAQEFGQGFGSNEYGNVYNRALGTYQTNFGNLQNLAGLGLNATNTGVTSGNVNASGQSSNLLQGLGIQADALTGAANARASGYVGGTNALTSGINGATGGLSNLVLLNKLIGGGGMSSAIGNGGPPVPSGYGTDGSPLYA